MHNKLPDRLICPHARGVDSRLGQRPLRYTTSDGHDATRPEPIGDLGETHLGIARPHHSSTPGMMPKPTEGK